LTARRLGLETQHESIVLMHADCPVAKSEGFAARAQVQLDAGGRTAVATLYFVHDGFLGLHEVGLSEATWRRLDVVDGSVVGVHHPRPLASMSAVRSKVYGERLGEAQLREIITDIVAERFSDVELAAFVTAFSSQPPAIDEIAALTAAMVGSGERIAWPQAIIVDKHCVGGLPGNRTTPIIVAIVAAAGLVIPKTSSRAITSPAGTADVMETMAPVNLDTAAMRRVVEQEGGCIVWGGSVRLSPADDILIRVQRALDFDCTPQVVASILSKKLAAGATRLILDLPVGPTAKIRSPAMAARLSELLIAVAGSFGLTARTVMSDGRQPVATGIGPALEARDVLRVLRRESAAPHDLEQRALTLSGQLLEMGGAAEVGTGEALAAAILGDGRALAKFLAICDAQGGFREPQAAPLHHVIAAPASGHLAGIDNRRLSRAAKLAGAPRSRRAGLELHVKLGERVERGEPLITLHGESRGELGYALDYLAANSDLWAIDPARS
jgi:thymidine phosphorylase